MSAISNSNFAWGGAWKRGAGTSLAFAIQPLQVLMSLPVPLYLGTLTVMLFRPPDLEFHCADRIAFLVLVAVIGLRVLLMQQLWRPSVHITWPMCALLLLVLFDLLSRPFESQVWSVAAAKYFVPYSLFYLAGCVFCDARSRKHLEIFALIVLGYLIYLAIASLAHMDALIYPKFILDPALGLNAMRARGPFLQPVANGAALNLLGLIALDAYGRGRIRRSLPVLLLIGGLPVAILATLTRSVWLGFGVSIILLWRWTHCKRVRRICWVFIMAGVLTIVLVFGGSAEDTAGGRLRDGDTVNFRMAAYEAGWSMFAERPILGWGASRVQTELADRIEGYRGDTFVVHNTYFEILLEHGVLGCVFYLWLVTGLIRVGRHPETRPDAEASSEFMVGRSGRTLWLLLLSVYFINATFVVMNYQFVNGLTFTIAGILACQSQRRPGPQRGLLKAQCNA
jgi:O-antigen ligase